VNKEQAEKHGDVIKWWLDNIDKGVWTRLGNPKEWRISNHPSWDMALPYVQNDEYAEFRKAQADGKVIQYDYHSNNHWVDIKIANYCDFIPQRMRIKPDEPKFKVGDWVRTIGKLRDGECDSMVIGHIQSDMSIRVFQTTKYYTSSIGEHTELWQPQEGDVVIYPQKCCNGHTNYIIDLYENVEHDYSKMMPYIGQDFKDMK